MNICILASSSSGNCTLVSHGDTHLLIDAGISTRRINEALKRRGLSIENLCGILITHEHSDHIGGLKTFSKHFKTPIYTSWGTGAELSRFAPETGLMTNCFSPGDSFELSEIGVKSFKTSHDCSESVGFTLCTNTEKLAYATDLGLVTNDCLDAVLGADTAIIEANHDVVMLKSGSYPPYVKRRVLSDHGHLSNDDSAEFALKLAASGTKRIVLAHLSRENNEPHIAFKTVDGALQGSGVYDGVELSVAPPLDLSAAYIKL